MAYNADYAGQQAAAAGQQAYDPSAVDPETAKAYEQAWAQYYAALGTDPNAAAAATGGGQDVSAGGIECDWGRVKTSQKCRVALCASTHQKENSASFRDIKRRMHALFPQNDSFRGCGLQISFRVVC